MSLTEEQKRKIKEEEEKYRANIKKNLNKTSWWKPKGTLTWLVLIFIVLSIIFGSLMSNSSEKTTTSTDTTDLEGNVIFNDFKFNVINSEDKDWNYCHFTLNKDYNYPGNSFSDKVGPIKAGETVTIPSGQFAKSDGTRFDPFSVKPQSLGLDCNKRFGYWEWK